MFFTYDAINELFPEAFGRLQGREANVEPVSPSGSQR